MWGRESTEAFPLKAASSVGAAGAELDQGGEQREPGLPARGSGGVGERVRGDASCAPFGCAGPFTGAQLRCEGRKGCPGRAAPPGRKSLLINNLLLVSWLIQSICSCSWLLTCDFSWDSGWVSLRLK